jgi:cell division septation protein DedD
VARNRTAVCGFQPTLVKRTAPTATTPEEAAPTQRVAKVAKPAPLLGGLFAPKPLDTVASIKAKPATPKAVAAVRKPAPAPRAVTQTRVVRKPVVGQRVVATPVAPVVQPKVVVRQTQVPKVKPVKRKVTVAKSKTKPVQKASNTTCANATSFSRQYINKSTAKVPVRCGPQAGPIVTVGTGRAVALNNPSYPLDAAQKQGVRQQAIVSQKQTVRRAALQQRVTTQRVKGAVRRTTNVQLPEGYRSVWSDDRLNQLRAQVTAAGNAQTDLIWTRTVPRRLIDTRTRSDVTKLFPNLRFPFLNQRAQQQADYNTRISTKSVRVPAPKAVIKKQAKRVVAKPAPRKPTTAAVKGQYVQIGTFGSPANVQKNINRLKASGMPVRVSNVTRKGKKLQIVLAGPFKSSDRTSKALRALRGAGYSDAFVR